MTATLPRDVRGDVQALADYLAEHARGRENAKRAAVIRQDLGYSDRVLRVLAHDATAAGVLICAGNEGYFIPATAAEVEETIGRLRSQAFEMLTRAGALARLASARFDVKLRTPRPRRVPDLFDLAAGDG